MFVTETHFRILKKYFGQGFHFQRKIKILGSFLKWGLTVSQDIKQ